MQDAGKMWTDNIERLAQHPCVKHTANLRPTVVADADLVSTWFPHELHPAKTTLTPEMEESHKQKAVEAVRSGTASVLPRPSRLAAVQLQKPLAQPQHHSLAGDFGLVHPTVSEPEALYESSRCLKCADAPCVKACPAGVDIRSFMYAISKENYYQAARVILSDNPLGLTCGLLCSSEHSCRSCCNLRDHLGGSIEISRMQQFACDVFRKMELPLARDPSLPAPDKMPPAFSSKIALVGAGPASLSCATFLARLGYSNITIFEKAVRPGGQPFLTIPEYRIPSYVTEHEASLVTELGVKIEFGKELGVHYTMESLKKDYASVFLGIGLPHAFTLPILAEPAKNLFTANDFLHQVSTATRPLVREKLPALSGHVVVLGGGDVAYDVANTSFRCGAKRVTIIFREDLPHKPCSESEFVHGAVRHNVEVYSNLVPVALNREEGKVTGIVLEAKDWVQENVLFRQKGQQITVGCDFVITAFGSIAHRAVMAPLDLLPQGLVKIDPMTNATSVPGVFAGGDCVGSVTIVQAVNDGKTAAWNMHKMLQTISGNTVPESPRMPMLHTAVDNVDISIDVCGIHFPNPFGLSSATPTGSIAQIRRAFEMGWGFAVTKTAVLEPITNISPRIIRSPTSPLRGPNQVGFQNIELLTEKTMTYWVEGVKLLKREFPQQIVIFSIMAPMEQGAWEKVAIQASSSNPDALELNLSCPHVGKKGFGMLAGQTPEAVKQITAWVRAATPKNIPVFVKLTPNVTDITQIAIAAKEGGADGVTAINTVSGLTNVQPNGIPWPAVGSAQKTAYGGVSGNMIRPIALKAVSAIRKALPDFPILGVGGIDSAESAMQMLRCGASVIQITSAIQNQEYTIIDELVNGVKAALYMQSQSRFATWKGQMPPKNYTPVKETATTAVPKLESQVGVTVSRITVVPELDLQAQVRAVIDLNACMKCGKCYMSCNDTGYVAIQFDPNTHYPIVTDDCMGCGLCQSVCPADCITYEVKKNPHKPCRGIRDDPTLHLPFD